MTIAIASTRGPKVEAVKKTLSTIRQFLTQDTSPIRYLTYDVDGGIAMPRTIDELLRGAQQRVVALQQQLQSEHQHVDFFVGMEGGFHTIMSNGKNLVFLQSWAYVHNGLSGYFGSSGNILVPDSIAHEVMSNGRDLAEVIDEASNQTDIRSKQGTWGILTKDLLTRQQSFEIALTAAFAPFYNKGMYTSDVESDPQIGPP